MVETGRTLYPCGMHPSGIIDPLAAQFRRFAEHEASGHSPLYESLALGVAADPAILALLADLPPEKRQPNLLFAAWRIHFGVPESFARFRARLLADPAPVLATIRARRTQTNEAGRCAVLLPILARLHQPLALIEVGASAGLCLNPDHYAYDYAGTRLGPDDAPILSCEPRSGAPIPTAMPRIAWRAGMDLEPITTRDTESLAWLEALIWPDQADRRARLRASVEVLRRNPVRLRQGDLTTDLTALLQEAPVGPTLVVFHTATLAYVRDAEARAAFASTLWEHSAVWISNEAPMAFPDIAARASRPGPKGAFLLAVNGEPMAWTDPHGGWIDWLG